MCYNEQVIISSKGPRDLYDIGALGSELKKIGYQLVYEPEMESTMAEFPTNNLIHQNVVILTDHQTKGAGRNERRWSDKAYSSIIFSLIVRINPSNIAVLADLCAMKACDSLNQFAGKEMFKIKYPNDIVYENKKLCGVLVKNFYDDDLEYKYTNIGVGINVHYGIKELAAIKADYEADSLDNVLKNTVRREDVLRMLIINMQKAVNEADIYDNSAQAGVILDAKWKDLSSVYGNEIKIVKNGKIIDSGKVVNTGIGRGIEMQTALGYKWFNLFEGDMSVRMSQEVIKL